MENNLINLMYKKLFEYNKNLTNWILVDNDDDISTPHPNSISITDFTCKNYEEYDKDFFIYSITFLPKVNGYYFRVLLYKKERIPFLLKEKENLFFLKKENLESFLKRNKRKINKIIKFYKKLDYRIEKPKIELRKLIKKFPINTIIKVISKNKDHKKYLNNYGKVHYINNAFKDVEINFFDKELNDNKKHFNRFLFKEIKKCNFLEKFFIKLKYKKIEKK